MHAQYGIGLILRGAQKSLSGRGMVQAEAGDVINHMPRLFVRTYACRPGCMRRPCAEDGYFNSQALPACPLDALTSAGR